MKTAFLPKLQRFIILISEPATENIEIKFPEAVIRAKLFLLLGDLIKISELATNSTFATTLTMYFVSISSKL